MLYRALHALDGSENLTKVGDPNSTTDVLSPARSVAV